MLTIENWMLMDVVKSCILGVSQLFVRRNSERRILLLLAKLGDDFHAARKPNDIEGFMSKL